MMLLLKMMMLLLLLLLIDLLDCLLQMNLMFKPIQIIWLQWQQIRHGAGQTLLDEVEAERGLVDQRLLIGRHPSC